MVWLQGCDCNVCVLGVVVLELMKKLQGLYEKDHNRNHIIFDNFAITFPWRQQISNWLTMSTLTLLYAPCVDWYPSECYVFTGDLLYRHQWISKCSRPNWKVQSYSKQIFTRCNYSDKTLTLSHLVPVAMYKTGLVVFIQ